MVTTITEVENVPVQLVYIPSVSVALLGTIASFTATNKTTIRSIYVNGTDGFLPINVYMRVKKGASQIENINVTNGVTQTAYWFLVLEPLDVIELYTTSNTSPDKKAAVIISGEVAVITAISIP